MMNKVSVIIPTYNSERSIEQTINSVLNQSGINMLFEIELIVVDDCSTDSTTVILKKNNIRYQSTGIQSGGPNKGRNMGLKSATGNYICLMDHDDIWAPDKIKKQLEVAVKYPIVSCGYLVKDIYMQRTIERCNHSDKPIIYNENETFLKRLKRENTGQNFLISSLMFQSKFKDIYFEENFGQLDFDWILRMTEGRSTAEIPECLVIRHVDSTNLSLNDNYRRKDYYYSLYIFEKYLDKYQEETKKGILHLHGSRARFHYLQNDMKLARKFFYKSEFSWKLPAYILTSFAGSSFIKKKFAVFG